MVAYAATSYNTGYMHGDIKGAFLSDTDTTNAKLQTLLVNYVQGSTFETNQKLDGWCTLLGRWLIMLVSNLIDYVVIELRWIQLLGRAISNILQ